MLHHVSYPEMPPKTPMGDGILVSHSEGKAPSHKMQLALAEVAQHLFPAMRASRGWAEHEHRRCLWSSASTAEFLRRRGVRAKAILGACGITLIDQEGASDWERGSVVIGIPDNGHPGLHALVAISDRSGPWLLDVNVWQGKRRRFPGLPDIVALSQDRNIPVPATGGFCVRGVWSSGYVPYRVHLIVAPHRPLILTGTTDDRKPLIARDVANIMEARIAQQQTLAAAS